MRRLVRMLVSGPLLLAPSALLPATALAQQKDRDAARQAAIHPVSTAADMRLWLSRVPVTRDFLARGTFAARTIVACALQCLRKRARQRRLPNPMRPGQQVRVRDAIRRNALRQRAHCPVVTDDVPV